MVASLSSGLLARQQPLWGHGNMAVNRCVSSAVAKRFSAMEDAPSSTVSCIYNPVFLFCVLPFSLLSCLPSLRNASRVTFLVRTVILGSVCIGSQLVSKPSAVGLLTSSNMFFKIYFMYVGTLLLRLTRKRHVSDLLGLELLMVVS